VYSFKLQKRTSHILTEKDYFDCKNVVIAEYSEKVLVNKGRYILSFNIKDLTMDAERDLGGVVHNLFLTHESVVVFLKSSLVSENPVSD